MADGLKRAANSATVLRWRDATPDDPRRAPFDEVEFDELDIEFDSRHKVIWCYQKHTERPNFTPGLLRDVRAFQRSLPQMSDVGGEDREPGFQYLVWASRLPEVFNLGGDLSLIARLVRSRDHEGLLSYARACIDICYANSINLDLPIITIGLVQGDALGGGFEAALSNDLVIAEEDAKFGFPEVLFNLFPGMGGYSFLARRVGAKLAEQLIFSGRVYGVAELHEMGVVDILADRGKGEDAVYEYIAKHARHHNAHRAIYKVRRRFHPLTYEELADVIDIWVEAALAIGETNIRRMERLALAQERRKKLAEGR